MKMPSSSESQRRKELTEKNNHKDYDKKESLGRRLGLFVDRFNLLR